jgi:hypothetical protein
VTIDAWLGAMGTPGSAYQRLSHDQLLQHLAAAPPGPSVSGFPMGERLAWTTDRNTMYPGQGPSADSARADAELDALNPTMTDYAARAATHEVAAAVRAEMAKPTATAASVIAAVRGADAVARAGLWGRFPTLHNEVVARFPADQAAIDAAVGP